MRERSPKIGVGVIVLRDGSVLLGERKGSHGAGTWALPGGHLEFGESIEQCAARELEEETGLIANHFALGPYTNTVFVAEAKHYVTLFVIAQSPIGEPQVLEPEKCSSWHWFSWSSLPEPLFQPLASLVGSGWSPQSIDKTGTLEPTSILP